MIIPPQFPGFHKKTLLVIADHVHARLFLGSDYELIFLEEMKTDHSNPEGDDRTSMISSAGGHGAIINEKDSIIGEDHLFRAIAKNVHIRLQKQEFEDLILAAGPEVRTLENLLHQDAQERIIKRIPKLLVKMNDEQLFEHLWS